MQVYFYDLETYKNCFLFAGKFEDDPKVQTFEMSFRKNERSQLLNWLSYLQNLKCFNVGYNNLNFDYPIIHELLNNVHTFDYHAAYNCAQKIIKTQGYGFTSIKLSDRILPQLDMMKINHFDNAAKRTSLKALQFAMRSESVEDLPFDPHTDLTSEQIDRLIAYNIHDITETEAFFKKCKQHVLIRKELLDNGIISGDVMNYSDVKIGTEYLTKKIGRAKCFQQNKPRQTFRPELHFKDLILPKIWFRTEPYQAVLDWFNKQIIYPGNDESPKPHLEVDLAGLKFDFGVGGVHASVEGKKFVSTDTYVIKDIDVSGMYVAVAIANGFYPEHLGQEFVDAYKQLQSDRAQYKKGTTMNLILKLAGNGVFGNSNNTYSCFYDPKYTYSVTLNGQLQLLQLVEVLAAIPGLQIIQANTDGITAYMPRSVAGFFDVWKKDWEKQTNLKLEEANFKKMWIRDVNNYIAIGDDGKIKSKGAYWYPKVHEDYWGSSGSNWNKDFSCMVTQIAIENVLINGWSVETAVKLCSDPFDFMLRYKTPGGATVYIGDKPQLRTVRYYVSTTGQKMVKVANPKGEIGDWKRKNGLTDAFYNKIKSELPKGAWDERIHTKAKSKYEKTVTGIEAGRLVKECNKASDFNWNDLDYDYYIEEVKKLIIGE